ncbi:hypothetical protein HOLleu_15524 [Holothuria leucospilota]|uniref:Fibronectin type-III domain-containing protein n=1 Tax=Holothuria leucospilota TaxID=206669 RepID=A0A9Q1H9N0_HOLLE|nr:hypothetical protein HOLleu_15524 [Holothuria leucospilota]
MKVLPTLAQPPLLTDVTCNSITIVWDKWTEETDSGTPPIIYYIPYHRISGSSDWTSPEIVPHRDVDEKYKFTFFNLSANSSFEFCIVAVREGYGGEGDKNNIIQGKTDTCKGIEAYIVAISVITPVAVILILVVVVFIFLRTSSGQRSDGEQVEATYENDAFGDIDDYSTISKDHFESQLTMYQGLKTIGSTKMTLDENPEKDNDGGYEVPVPSSSRSNIQLSSVTRENVEDDKGIALGQYEYPDISAAKSNNYVNLKRKASPTNEYL